MLHWCRALLCVCCCQLLINPCGVSQNTVEDRARKERGNIVLCASLPVFFSFFFLHHSIDLFFFQNISPSCRICRYAHCPGISKSIPAGIIHSVSFLPLWQKVAWIMDVYQGKWTKEPVGTRGYELCCSLYLFYCCIYKILAVINRHVCPFKKLWESWLKHGLQSDWNSCVIHGSTMSWKAITKINNWSCFQIHLEHFFIDY